ncbi:MAG: tRNA (N6-isopentenyl adenosine(37)-C2)-methylthiotransferase MiaB [Verrucomicrobiota bacterium]|nr:tRNA (N6-isopentenyl adenosine(37)-C2)-methylthiotransferase MiaB [Verrucomicrobiota bacterium]
MAKVYIKTYGCQMNERDSDQVSHSLVARGHVVTTKVEEADVVLLNTCSVRDMAEQKAIGKMRQAVHSKPSAQKHLVLGFLGCMAQSRADQLFKDVPGINLVVGTQKFHRVADYVEELLAAEEDKKICATEEELDSQNTIRHHTLEPQQASAFVSVMQGCNMHCTFCIVPDTRGEERSRPISEIVEEVRNLAKNGVKEVTLLGQIVNLYGRHEFEVINGLSPFVQLIEAVHDIDGIERIRFTSPHPVGFKQDLIEAFGRLPKLCEHVHMPMQSGSSRILKLMHRPYTMDKFHSLINAIRAQKPDIAVTTDIIVGFPGETEADYAETRQAVETIGFDNAFVFRYSKRKNTPAAEMPDQVSEPVKEARNQELLEILKFQAMERTNQLIGQDVEILVEGPSKTNPDRLSGRTRKNELVVFDGGSSRHIGQIMKVRINSTTGYTLYGQADILNLLND